MLSDHLVWVALAGAAVVLLACKGYLKLPARAGSPPNPSLGTPFRAASLADLDSGTLGLYFALAVRREAETDLARKIALKAGADITTTFTAPFSPPDPAGQSGPVGASDNQTS